MYNILKKNYIIKFLISLIFKKIGKVNFKKNKNKKINFEKKTKTKRTTRGPTRFRVIGNNNNKHSLTCEERLDMSAI
jgi:hypothetical protein